MLSSLLGTRPAGEPDPPEPEPEPSGRQLSDGDLLDELVATVGAAQAFQEFRRSHRKECFNLLRWLQLLLPLIEELGVPHVAFSCANVHYLATTHSLW